MESSRMVRNSVKRSWIRRCSRWGLEGPRMKVVKCPREVGLPVVGDWRRGVVKRAVWRLS